MTWPGWSRASFVFVVLTLFVTAQAQIWSSTTAAWGGRPISAVLATAYTVPLVLARRVPLVVLLVIMASATIHYWLGGSSGQPWFALVLAVFALAAHGSLRSGAVGMLAVALGILSIDLPRLQQGEPLDEVLPAWFILAATWGFGRWMQGRRRDHDDLVACAEAVERDREEAARAAVVHERARIARELHDMVAHSLAVIVLQAQAAERVLTADPTGARRALGAIESVGREGLDELRRLLEVLLVTDDGGLDPRPSLRHLDVLVERVREAGLPVEVTVDGSPTSLPAGIDVSAYRIVQEALTNVLKHSGAVSAAVGLNYCAGVLEVQVTDDGSREQPFAPEHVGHGLIGMRERVTLYGGTLDTGQQPAGGFRVLARLPLGGSS